MVRTEKRKRMTKQAMTTKSRKHLNCLIYRNKKSNNGDFQMIVLEHIPIETVTNLKIFILLKSSLMAMH
jgi:hypothetical protein